MSDNENDLWSNFTSDIKPLHTSEKLTVKKTTTIPEKKEPEITETVIVKTPEKKPVTPSSSSNEMDKRTKEKLVNGKLKIERKIDLHGLNREEAQDKLTHFVQSSYKRGYRMLLVITGKGARSVNPEHWMEDRRGILKEKLPQWLSMEPLKPVVLQFHSARPRDGGDGAFYVYLRKNK